MQEIERKIREFGLKANWTGLQEYIVDIDTEKLENLVRKKINNSDFESLWNYLLHGFIDSHNSCKKRFALIICCIETLKSKDVNAINANAVIDRICMKLPTFDSSELVALSQLCLEYIQKGNVSETCWREFLPAIVNVIMEREHIVHNELDLSGFEYKTQVVKSLIFMELSANIVIPLTSMFIDMPLSKDEHLDVVKKLVRYMEKLTAQEIPSFVYQLLRLCRDMHSKAIFFKLQNYFGSRIYSKNLIRSDTNSESMDFISNVVDEEIQQAESTVFFHIYQSALLTHKSVKEYLNYLKSLIKTPEFILHPFQLSVLLCISTVGSYEDVVFTMIRQSISRSYFENDKAKDSNWLKTVVPEAIDLDYIFKQIIDNSVNERDLIVQGLVNLSFVLLGVGALLGRESSFSTRQWNLGKYILLNLVKQKTHIAHSVLQRLCNHIVTNNSTTQYIDCFREFSKKFMLLTLENKSCVVELMEALLQVSEPIADQILDSVIPLTKVSPTIRDHLILLLRKALFSRNTSTRQMAVRGFLKLLKNLKISNLAALSQINSSHSSSSGHSVLTQISLNRTVHCSQPSVFSNESLCLEVLGILRRCFMQQAEVRAKLYEGLYDAVSKNPEISSPVLDVLWSHFIIYYIMDENTSPPIDFGKISVIKDMDAVLEEPIGKLIHAIGLIVIKVFEVDEENTTAKMFLKVLDSIIVRMNNCELIHFELDDGNYLLDVLPECQKKVITLKEAMCVYEALIGFRIASWGKKSENFSQDVYGLFRGYFRLQQCAKNVQKTKKGDKKKKQMNKTLDQTRDSQSTKTTQIDSSKSSLSTIKPKRMKMPDTILDFKTLIKFLKLLHCTVNWTTTAQANVIKSKVEIHRHVMQATICVFQNLKGTKSVEANKKYFHYCCEIGSTIYTRCIARLDDFNDFDSTTAALAAECFHLILTLVCNYYNSDLKNFLAKVGEQSKESETLEHIGLFIEKYEELFEIDFNGGTDDLDIKKLRLTIISTLALLVQQLPNEPSVQSNKFIEWIKNYSTQNTLPNRAVATIFVGLWFSSYVKFKTSVTIFEEIVDNLLNLLGSFIEEKEGTKTFDVINEITAHTFVEKLSIIVKFVLDDIDWIVNRLKSEFGVLSYSVEDSIERRRENLRDKERGVCCQLCLLITLIESMCTILVPAGALSEAVLKVIMQLYNCLNNLTKYFITRSSKVNPAFQTARFERVIKLTGKQLSPAVNNFVLYLGEADKDEQSQEKENPGKKKSGGTLKSKVLRETKMIPKVVYEIEQLTKSVIQLSKKTKVDLAKFIGPGTTRDFRIKDLKGVVLKSGSNNESFESNETDESIQEVNEEEANEDDQNEDDDDPGIPPSKKSKS